MSFSWGILSTGRIAEDFANCLQINKCIQFFFSFCFEKKKIHNTNSIQKSENNCCWKSFSTIC